MKTKFDLPETKMCVVMWYRNGVRGEQLIETPYSNSQLYNTMLMCHKVGYSEIRAVKAVRADELVEAMSSF